MNVQNDFGLSGISCVFNRNLNRFEAELEAAKSTGSSRRSQRAMPFPCLQVSEAKAVPGSKQLKGQAPTDAG